MFIHERFASCSYGEVREIIKGKQEWLKQYDVLQRDGILDDVPRVAASLRVLGASCHHDIKTLERYSRLMKKEGAEHVRDLEALEVKHDQE